MSDPRESLGYIVESELMEFELIPSRHTTPDTGGLLDYGILARLPDGRRVVIGELFARAPGDHPVGVRLDTKKVGEWIVATLNMAIATKHPGLNAQSTG